MEDLDSYLEDVYHDSIKVKAKCTGKILQLARNKANLGELVQNETLMGALSRVFKEDYKKSLDLCLNLATIFCNFSNFSQMHPILMSKGLGAMTMKVIELEIKRYELRMGEMKKMEAAIAKSKESKVSFDPRKEKKKTLIFIKKQEKLLYVAVHMLLNLAEDLAAERK
eukprot:GSMAST32.ASY1.ANO1.2488.1 assembled CDS